MTLVGGIGALCDENHVAKGATLALGMDKVRFFFPNSSFGSRAKSIGTSSSNTHSGATKFGGIVLELKKPLSCFVITSVYLGV